MEYKFISTVKHKRKANHTDHLEKPVKVEQAEGRQGGDVGGVAGDVGPPSHLHVLAPGGVLGVHLQSQLLQQGHDVGLAPVISEPLSHQTAIPQRLYSVFKT